MRALVLGSGGSQPTPKAGCGCRVCTRARLHGGPNVRTGPSVYLPDHSLLVDTPEESNAQLNTRLGATRPRHVVWTHFHPDHTAGMRVVELLARWNEPILAFMPDDLEQDLTQKCAFLFGHLRNEGHVRVQTVQADQAFQIGGLAVTMLRHAGAMPMYSLLLEDQHGRGLYNGDHFISLWPRLAANADLRGLDWAVLHIGIIPDGWQEEPLPANHPARQVLVPIREMLATARDLAWKHVVFTHIYEAVRLHPEELEDLAAQLGQEFGLLVQFASDGLRLGNQKNDAATAEEMHATRQELAQRYGHDRKRMREEMRKLSGGG